MDLEFSYWCLYGPKWGGESEIQVSIDRNEKCMEASDLRAQHCCNE